VKVKLSAGGVLQSEDEFSDGDDNRGDFNGEEHTDYKDEDSE